ncbi:MAG: hypothetical protein ACFFCE_05775 [Promethearchaeota archaeon]
MVNKERFCTSIELKGDYAVYVRKLKNMGFNISRFIREAIQNYVKIHSKNLQKLIMFADSMNKPTKFINEE